MSLPQTRSTTTFSSGSSLTITKNSSTVLITRHPRTIPVRHAEARSKALLTKLSTDAPPLITPKPVKLLLYLVVPLITLVPIAVHILHKNELITTLAHLPAAVFTCFLLYLFYTFPHITYFAVTSDELIHRSRGLLRDPTIYSLSTIRSFLVMKHRIVTDSIVKPLILNAPDHETAFTAVQALNKALSATQHTPPPVLLSEDGNLIITGMTPLSSVNHQVKLSITRMGDRIIVSKQPPKFPKLVFLSFYFFLTTVLTSLLLLFIFDDLPRTLRPMTASTISAIAIPAFYLAITAIFLVKHGINSIPRKWKLVVAGYRKDVETGMIDVGRCREVILERKRDDFRVKVVSSTGNAFLDVGGLCEAEASTLLTELRDAFPALFQGGV